MRAVPSGSPHQLGAALALVKRRWLLACCAALCVLVPVLPSFAAPGPSILVIYANNRLLPGTVAFDRGLRDAMAGSSHGPVQVFSEFLDIPYFTGAAHEDTVASYIHAKYAARPPQAIVVVNDGGVDFILRNRDRLFPAAPIVHAVTSKAFLQSLPAPPADMVGVPMEYDFAGTIELALRLHPQARRLLVVTGASQRDRGWEARLRREAREAVAARGVDIEFLAGMATPALLQRLGALDAQTVVFTPGYYEDGAGRVLNPAESAALMAGASSAPVYGSLETFVGSGVVGGRSPSFEGMGRQAAKSVDALLAGAAPESIDMSKATPNLLRIDWRQVQRWGIDERDIPADAVLQFKAPTLWQAYRNEVLIVVAVVLLQAALIAALLFERRRRHAAEGAVQKQRTELAHASRLAVAGELTASIAHEINQPLGAILASADAAELLLQSGVDRRDDLLRIVTRIRRDDLRASDVIQRLRSLLAKHKPERQRFDLNVALADVATLLGGQARQRQVVLDIRPARESAFIDGDPVQIQQVLINLVLNAMDAVAGLPEARRVVSVSLEARGDGVIITVQDRGHGIAAEHLPRLFDSFFSTKQKGMGLGLSIARTIVEAHGGRIRAENGRGEGALFHVELPTRTVAQAAVLVPT